MADNFMQYTLSVVPTLNDAAQPAVAVASGNSADQAALPLTAYTLAASTAHAAQTLPSDGKGFGVFGTGRFNCVVRAGGTSATLPCHQFPETNTPGTPYKVGFYIPGLVSQIVVSNPDPDDAVDILTVGA